ncbi:MAG TPA: ATP-binding protein [Actinomycetales bacterium]|nr:ATP-binding protein [Actinomycetales bacterium]
MDPALAAVLGGTGVLVLVAVAVGATNLSDRLRGVETPAPRPVLPPGAADVLAVLRSSAVLVDRDEHVLKASPAAHAYGIVAEGRVSHPELRHLARQVGRDGVIREAELELARGPLGRGTLVVRARVAPLGSELVLLLVEDHTEARRVEEVRRDFLENVSHELKTPVGGLSLLAEALLGASDDPEAVRRFASRMQVESQRLTRLVQDIVDLSRLQVADTLKAPQLVDVGPVVAEAVDRCRVRATAQQAELTVETGFGADAARVYGDVDLLVTAVTNLVDNALAYSSVGSPVAVRTSVDRGLVSVAVTDRGVGIPQAEQSRIFERFYRVDPARSRSTGGTGLGLAVVKHGCANHGGEVVVRSEPGVGSTFTVRLPLVPAAGHPAPERGSEPATSERTPEHAMPERGSELVTSERMPEQATPERGSEPATAVPRCEPTAPTTPPTPQMAEPPSRSVSGSTSGPAPGSTAEPTSMAAGSAS